MVGIAIAIAIDMVGIAMVANVGRNTGMIILRGLRTAWIGELFPVGVCNRHT